MENGWHALDQKHWSLICPICTGRSTCLSPLRSKSWQPSLGLQSYMFRLFLERPTCKGIWNSGLEVLQRFHPNACRRMLHSLQNQLQLREEKKHLDIIPRMSIIRCCCITKFVYFRWQVWLQVGSFSELHVTNKTKNRFSGLHSSVF